MSPPLKCLWDIRKYPLAIIFLFVAIIDNTWKSINKHMRFSANPDTTNKKCIELASGDKNCKTCADGYGLQADSQTCSE